MQSLLCFHNSVNIRSFFSYFSILFSLTGMNIKLLKKSSWLICRKYDPFIDKLVAFAVIIQMIFNGFYLQVTLQSCRSPILPTRLVPPPPGYHGACTLASFNNNKMEPNQGPPPLSLLSTERFNLVADVQDLQALQGAIPTVQWPLAPLSFKMGV